MTFDEIVANCARHIGRMPKFSEEVQIDSGRYLVTVVEDPNVDWNRLYCWAFEAKEELNKLRPLVRDVLDSRTGSYVNVETSEVRTFVNADALEALTDYVNGIARRGS